eukprot:scaffold60454_cov38-Prasinocladus_malaysianus.AAC.1
MEALLDPYAMAQHAAANGNSEMLAAVLEVTSESGPADDSFLGGLLLDASWNDDAPCVKGQCQNAWSSSSQTWLAVGLPFSDLIERDRRMVLLSYGANADWQNSNGYTALMRAALRGNEDVVQHLLEAGADLSLANSRRRTAEDLAEGKRHGGVAQLIRAYRMDATEGRRADKRKTQYKRMEQ